jgi:hypothetical protein
MTRSHRRLTRRTSLVVLSAVAALVGSAPSAHAEKKTKKGAPQSICATSWIDAETRTNTGRLREAHDLLRTCARPACGPLYTLCAAKLEQLETEIPTVVPIVTNESGIPLVDVMFAADGELMASRLDGRGLAINPGLHTFSFSTSELGVFSSQTILIVQGQRNRPILVEMQKGGAPSTTGVAAATKTGAPEKGAADAPAKEGSSPREAPDPAPAVSETTKPGEDEPAPKKHGPSALPYVIGGLGLASLGAGALLTFWGRQDNAALSACSPNCSPGDVDHVANFYVLSDIALGVGAAAVGVATVMLILRGGKGSEKVARTGYVLDVQPAPSGAFATIRGSF